MKFLGSATVSSRGQIVIPKKVRELFKLEEGEDIIFAQDDKGQLYIIKENQITIQEKEE
ncbi:MAG TPA: AbrB/MazE/SpoVT family DNA-binding domain-containing protein [Candidatus Bathyarchaeia archaeon]|nr:AbrB/MazE/SpoVT family DNA-binding domain-containing protein [Candidatus Bathyarchaeia archaeon]